MANTLGIISFIGQQVFSYGLGIAGLVWAIKKMREKKK